MKFLRKTHLLILSLFPNITLILLFFLHFFSWDQPCLPSLWILRSSSLLCLCVPYEDIEAKRIAILEDFLVVSSNRPPRQWRTSFPRMIFIIVHLKEGRILFSYRFCLACSSWSLLKWSCSVPHSCFVALHWTCVLVFPKLTPSSFYSPPLLLIRGIELQVTFPPSLGQSHLTQTISSAVTIMWGNPSPPCHHGSFIFSSPEFSPSFSPPSPSHPKVRPLAFSSASLSLQ